MEIILTASKIILNLDCSTVHKPEGFWHQTCQHSSQPWCLSWSYSLSLSNSKSLFVVCIYMYIYYLGLHQISAICHCLSEDDTKKLLCAFVVSRLDYWNSLVAGCPKYLLSKLQTDNGIFRQIEVQWHSHSRSWHENKLIRVDKRYSFLKWSGWQDVQWHVIDLCGQTCQLLYAFRSEDRKRQEKTL